MSPRVEAPVANERRIGYFKELLADSWRLSREDAARRSLYCGTQEAVDNVWDPVTRTFLTDEIARAFLTECLRDGTAASAPERRDVEKRAAALVGVLQVGSSFGFSAPGCHAAVLGTRQVVTAAHCFVTDSGVPTQLAAALLDGRLYFSRQGSPPIRIVYDAWMPLPWRTFGDSGRNRADDFALLRVNEMMPSDLGVDGYTDIEFGDLLYTPAFWFAERAADGRLFADIDDELCRVAAVADDGDCFVHACQSIPSVSGSPVFKIETDGSGSPTGRIFFAGIHTGAAALAENERERACGPEAPPALGADPAQSAPEAARAETLGRFNRAVAADRFCRFADRDGACRRPVVQT